MKYKLNKFRMTIPQEIRSKANIDGNGYIDISFDDNTGNIIISSKLKPETEKVVVKKETKKKEPKKKEPKKEVKKSTKTTKPKKIEANFMDADKLYKAYYSECGLVVRTKNKYLKDFCEQCQGQLAREWEDRVEAHCKYLTSNFQEVAKQIDKEQEKLEQTIQEEITKMEAVENEIEQIRKKRKEDIANISKSIKEANKVIDEEIDMIEPKQKRGRPKKQKRYSTGNTILKPVKTDGEKFLNCTDCGEFVGKGFYLDDEFLCKECAVRDFKEYLKRRGM